MTFHFTELRSRKNGKNEDQPLNASSKLTCWKVFTVANKNIINTFQRLGDNEDDTMIQSVID